MDCDKEYNFIKKMQTETSYIRIEDLKNGYSYKIYARNAYVGVWKESDKGFIISRYKTSPDPYIFIEYHWDINEFYGTVKPIELIEKCPFDFNDKKILDYLDTLEEKNPIIDGLNTLQKRKNSTMEFTKRLSSN
jgi:hypothetical protein